MDLVYTPRAPWHWIAFSAAAVVVILVVLTLILPSRRAVLGRTRTTRFSSAFLFVLAATAFAFASFNPLLVSQRNSQRNHIVVVLDISPSMLRAEGGWVAVHDAVSNLLKRVVDDLPEELRNEGTASIVVFRSDASKVEQGNLALNDLPSRVRSVPSDYIVGTGSNIAAGLIRAGELIDDAGGRGAVVLVSDGLQTEGDAEIAAQALARRGILIYAFGISSNVSELSIIAADLPRQAFAGTETMLRGTLYNGRMIEATAMLSVTLNSGLAKESPRVSASAGLTEALTLIVGPQGTAYLRAPLALGGHGLQFVDLTLSYDKGLGLQRRRFFTHVKRPLEILSIGGDRRWQSVFTKDAAKIKEIGPGQLAEAGDLRSYDAIVISAIAADTFASGELADIAQAVERDGLGLMLFNGDHGGSDQEAATVLKSFDETPIAPLLPIVSGPRPFEEEPPSRHVIFLIDASGSMSGWKLDKAKEITASIIENEMRPTDKVDIIAFNTQALHLVSSQETTPSAKPGIIGQLASFQANGGTDPTEALKLIQDQQFTECGLIVLSDGEFNVVNLRPDCHATAFSIGSSYSPALAQIADPFPVGPQFDPTGITLPYFSPEKRTRLWEPGEFTPLSTATISRTVVHLPIPALPLLGSAISHPKPESLVLAVRPKVKDPILAYAERGAGFVGVMTSAVTSEWLQNEAASSAIAEWIRQVVPYAARDRYDMRLYDDGDHMSLRIAIVAEAGHVPNVTGLQITLEQPDHALQPIPVVDESGSPATFIAELRPERSATATETTLVIRESGSDRLARPQRIPLVIPPLGSVMPRVTSEAYGSGLDSSLLTRVAEISGGRLLDQDAPGTILTLSPPGNDSRALWPWILLLGGTFYLSAIALKRMGL